MPEPLTSDEINSKTDPSVSKQWDEETPKKDQVQDFYNIVDSLKVGLLGTYRPGVGPVHRSMAVAKRDGPDFLFIATNHSQKFKDIEHDKTATVTFQNSSTQDWVSVTGEVTTSSNEDPRIKECYNKGTSAWFGDLGDGVHNGTADDPRMTLIEVKANYVSYWKATVGTLGFLKEVTQASFTGKVADTGALRQLTKEDLEHAREYTK